MAIAFVVPTLSGRISMRNRASRRGFRRARRQTRRTGPAGRPNYPVRRYVSDSAERERCETGAARAASLVWLHGNAQAGQVGGRHVPDLALEGRGRRAEVEFLAQDLAVGLPPIL